MSVELAALRETNAKLKEQVAQHQAEAAKLGPKLIMVGRVTDPRTGQTAYGGYRRADGRVGTRNEIWILCTVGCVARTAQKIAEAANALDVGVASGEHFAAGQFAAPQGVRLSLSQPATDARVA